MAVNPDIHDRAYQFFIEEVPELLQAIEDGILMLRQDRSAQVVHEVMRAAHSIKGGSASVELDAIKDISHRLETAFRALYDESVEIDLELETLLLRGYDCLQRPLNEQMETGYHDPEQALINAIPILEAIEEKLGEEALSQAESFIPSSSDLGVDMVMSIFEIDVEEGIARLEEVAANPGNFAIVGELQTQSEVFIGFGELLDLPGFRAIAQALSDAVAQAPENAEEILRVALVDLQAARNAVMGGDRDQGGVPSEALLAMAAGGNAFSMSLDDSVDSSSQMGWDDLEDLSLAEMDWGQEDSGTPMDMDSAALQELLGQAMNQISEPAEPVLADPFSDPMQAEESEFWGADDALQGVESILVEPPVAIERAESLADPWSLPTAELSSAEMMASLAEASAETSAMESFWVESSATDEMALDEVALDEVALDEVALDEVALDEAAADEAAADETSDVPLATVAFDADAAEADLADLFAFEEGDDAFAASPEVVPMSERFSDDSFSDDSFSDELFSDDSFSDEVSSNEIFSSESFGDEISSDEISSDEISSNEISSDEISSDEISSDEISSDEISSDESFSNESFSNESFSNESLDGQKILSTGDQLSDIDAMATWGQAAAVVEGATDRTGDEADQMKGGDVSALFGLEADSDMSPDVDIFSLVDWQVGDSLDAQLETAIPDAFSPADFAFSGGVEAVKAIDVGEAVEAVEAPDFGEVGDGSSDDLSNLLEAFDFPVEAGSDVTVIQKLDLNRSADVSADPVTDAPVHADAQAQVDSDAGIDVVHSTAPSPAATHAAVEVALAEERQAASQPATPQQPCLDAAVRAVENLFDQLPVDALGAIATPALVPNSLQAAPQTAETTAKAAKKESNRAAALSGISVRVDLSVLERMNNLVGELVLNRNSLSLQNDQLQAVVGQMSKRFSSFGTLVNGLREASDQMLLKPNSSEGTGAGRVLPSSQNQSEENLTAGFDSLEMDRYNGLHTQIQDIFEELMQLEEGVDDIDVLLEQTTQSISQQRQGLSRLQNELMWARMLPLDNILSRFPRVLRDLAAKHGKLVELNLVGTAVLVDKGILEKLHDPMLHLLRNAFDHGIELPEARQQQGKPEQGTIEVRAFYQGNQTVIEIKDDGRGLSLERIARRAVELGWMTREELRTIPQQVIADLIFEPNFSTAPEVTELSGRGVGLDVVREQIKLLKGSVSVTSNPGEGTTFSLKLPLTLSVAKLMVCQVGPLAIALPSDAIEDLLVPEPKRIKLVANQRFLHWRDDLIAIHPMGDLLDYSCPLPDATSLKNLTESTIPIPQDWAMPVLILKQGEQYFALEVNRLLMEQELVIKPFGNAATAPEYAYGCTILGDGQMIPVLDASALLGGLMQATSSFSGTGVQLGDDELSSVPNTSTSPASLATAPPSMSSVAPVRLSKTILVVDDSTAMRRTLALSLEKAGYRILQAGDGQEALEQLRQSSAVQLVICDVEMPTMNGFEFLSQRRREPELLKVPVVMLTSRSSDKHRRLALQLNANDYFSKPYVEQEFLKSIRAVMDASPTLSAAPV